MYFVPLTSYLCVFSSLTDTAVTIESSIYIVSYIATEDIYFI